MTEPSLTAGWRPAAPAVDDADRSGSDNRDAQECDAGRLGDDEVWDVGDCDLARLGRGENPRSILNWAPTGHGPAE